MDPTSDLFHTFTPFFSEIPKFSQEFLHLKKKSFKDSFRNIILWFFLEIIWRNTTKFVLGLHKNPGQFNERFVLKILRILPKNISEYLSKLSLKRSRVLPHFPYKIICVFYQNHPEMSSSLRFFKVFL